MAFAPGLLTYCLLALLGSFRPLAVVAAALAGPRARIPLITTPCGVEGVECLALRVDADLRVVLQHPARQVAADRLQHVIGDPEFGDLGVDRVPQIVEPEPRQTGGIAERPSCRVPLQHRLHGVIASPLARWPEKVIGLRVTGEIRAFDHPRNRFDGRRVERDHTMARLVLAAADVDQFLHECARHAIAITRSPPS